MKIDDFILLMIGTILLLIVLLAAISGSENTKLTERMELLECVCINDNNILST